MSVLFGDPRLPERFWEKVAPEPNSGCWLWTASLDLRGYGTFYLGGARLGRAHRISFSALVGDPGSSYVCHSCDVRSCVNPAHLWLGSHEDNMADMSAKGRHHRYWASQTHCRNGHPFSGNNLCVRDDGRRACRTCGRMATRRWKQRKAQQMAAA